MLGNLNVFSGQYGPAFLPPDAKRNTNPEISEIPEVKQDKPNSEVSEDRGQQATLECPGFKAKVSKASCNAVCGTFSCTAQ